MFNTLCRVAMLEDVLDSGEICPTLDDKDFSDMIPYLNMTYGRDSSLWFILDPRLDPETGDSRYRRDDGRRSRQAWGYTKDGRCHAS